MLVLVQAYWTGGDVPTRLCGGKAPADDVVQAMPEAAMEQVSPAPRMLNTGGP